MKIMLVNALYAPIIMGGAERSVTLLAEQLARAGDEVSVITLHPEEEEKVEALNGVRVYRLPLDNRYWPYGRSEKPPAPARLLWHMSDIWNAKAAERVGRILDEVRPDVVHTNILAGLSVAVWNEVKKRNIRLIHTLRDYYLLCSRSALFRHESNCERRCTDCTVLTAKRKPASQMVDTVVSISEYVLRCHTEKGYFAGSSSAVIYNIAGMAAQPKPAAEEPSTLVFGYVGRVQDEKGIRIVLEALKHVSGTNWRLKIAGTGLDSYVNALKREFIDPRIEWLGFVDAPSLYRSIDIALVSSLWAEPLSRTVIETFAAGKSAICAESGGIPEIARLGKVFATYPARDARALAAIMDKAMLDVSRWRSGGFRDEKARNLFTDTSITARYREIYSGAATTSAAVR